MNARTKILLASNAAWNISNFRGGLIKGMQAAGYEVVAAAPPDEYVPDVVDFGVRFVPVPMDNKGTNPIRDLALLVRFVRLFKQERPDVFLGFTVKPNVFGGLAARLLGIPVVNNIAGLGAAFMRDNWLRRLVESLYRVALGKSRKVFFQNDDDLRLFVERGLVRSDVTERLPGSGVDTAWFAPLADADESLSGRPFRFLLSSRLLWDKGVGEYVEAARKLQAEGANAEFQLLGFLEVANPSAIPRDQVERWERSGVVRYLGIAKDVRPAISRADCIVLPSYYREGTPRSLLEAASMAKPIITTNVVGCRDAIEEGVSGFLCRPRDANDLAATMRTMLAVPLGAREAMGKRGREKMIREFDERIVIDRYVKTIRNITGC